MEIIFFLGLILFFLSGIFFLLFLIFLIIAITNKKGPNRDEDFKKSLKYLLFAIISLFFSAVFCSSMLIFSPH